MTRAFDALLDAVFGAPGGSEAADTAPRTIELTDIPNPFRPQEIDAAETFALRRRVLRPDLTPAQATAQYAGIPDAFHLGIRPEAGGPPLAIVSLMPAARKGVAGTHPWRLRGFVCHPDWRRRGFGLSLIQAGVAEVTRRGGDVIWLHGRMAAARLYRRAGFAAIGPSFDRTADGPHRLFVRRPVVLPEL